MSKKEYIYARKTVEEKFNIEKNIEKLLRIYKEME